MTVAELDLVLDNHGGAIPLHICHFAKRAGKAKPIIRSLAEVRWIDGRLCLVEADDRKNYLADR